MAKPGNVGQAGRKAADAVTLRRVWRQDSAAPSVCWENEVPFHIVLVRRSDEALAFVEVPEELAAPLGRFSVAAVVEHANVLRAVVSEVVPMLEFESDGEIGATAVRDGATPASLGMVRHFKEGSFGVEIGEFELPVLPPRLI